jgi:hypothetical protein
MSARKSDLSAKSDLNGRRPSPEEYEQGRVADGEEIGPKTLAGIVDDEPRLEKRATRGPASAKAAAATRNWSRSGRSSASKIVSSSLRASGSATFMARGLVRGLPAGATIISMFGASPACLSAAAVSLSSTSITNLISSFAGG